MEVRSDGTPKMGFVGDMTGFEDREREARRSGLGAGLGTGDTRGTADVGSGVLRAEESLWRLVSIRRIVEGCCNRRTTKEAMRI